MQIFFLHLQHMSWHEYNIFHSLHIHYHVSLSFCAGLFQLCWKINIPKVILKKCAEYCDWFNIWKPLIFHKIDTILNIQFDFQWLELIKECAPSNSFSLLSFVEQIELNELLGAIYGSTWFRVAVCWFKICIPFSFNLSLCSAHAFLMNSKFYSGCKSNKTTIPQKFGTSIKGRK